MNRFKKILIIITVITSVIMTAWLFTDFYGGMFLYLVLFGIILIPIAIIHIISLLITVVLAIREGLRKNRIIYIAHTVVILAFLIIFMNKAEFLKSARVLEAYLDEGLNNYHLILRKDHTFEINWMGMLGVYSDWRGRYRLENDTIIFLDEPFENALIPDTVLLDLKENAIYIDKTNAGDFDRNKSFINHFRIDTISYSYFRTINE